VRLGKIGKTLGKVGRVALAIPTGGLSLAQNKKQAVKIAVADVAILGAAYGASTLFAPAAVPADSGLISSAGANIAGFDTSVPGTASGIWSSAASVGKGAIGAVKATGELAGAIASTRIIVDSLTGRHREITNTETVPSGWVIQDRAAGAPVPDAAMQDTGQASSIPWVPLAIAAAAAVLIGAR
jgi:hypothetical protein